MGLGASDITLLIALARSGHIGKGFAVAEIGAQQLSDSFLEAKGTLDALATTLGISTPCALPAPVGKKLVMHGATEHLFAQAPQAREFWRWLGFPYTAIDIDGTPGAIPLDLNYDDVPAASKGRFQLVTNYGTTEHVANQLNAFKVIHELTALHGVMIHNLPAQGMFNHGLVNYNPKFFWMLARSNGYKLLHMSFHSDNCYYPLPQNVLDNVLQFDAVAAEHLRQYKVADCALSVAFQKVFDTPYVAPIDVNTGTTTDNQALKKRYWSVFEPNAFDRLR